MKTVWLAGLALASTAAMAQSVIYKHVDESGRVTYSNKPIKGGAVVDLEPLTTIPGTPGGAPAAPAPVVTTAPAAQPAKPTPARLVVTDKPANQEIRQAAAVIGPVPRTTLAIADPIAPPAKPREDPRRKELLGDITREEQSLAIARASLAQEQQNPALVAAVRMAQQASEPTAAQQAQFRENIERASGRIRGLQATVAEHEKNLEALKKELDGLKQP